MKRKTIALCVTGYDKEYETRIAEGIARRCSALDINLLVFASLIRKPDLNSGLTLPESVIKGETAVFDLINYNMLDGIIILGDSIIDESVIEKVHRLAQKNNVPVININDPTHVLDKNITLSDKCAMKFVMKHLVEDHGLTRINFIGGFPGNLQTEERLAGYKKVLTEHNIPVEERRIAYGQFWTKAADCTREFLKDELPQAIVCASDTMAIFCMDELKNQGYLKYYKQRDKKQKPADFLRYTSSDGFEILVGRNNAQNDKLTLHTARGKDLWFHVQKAPGSHVVVMSRGEDIPDTTKQEAAELAVIHSSAYKAGTGAKVAVDTTEVKNIWKANGAKPGMVLYEVYTTVYITPREGLEEQLKKK